MPEHSMVVQWLSNIFAIADSVDRTADRTGVVGTSMPMTYINSIQVLKLFVSALIILGLSSNSGPLFLKYLRLASLGRILSRDN